MMKSKHLLAGLGMAMLSITDGVSTELGLLVEHIEMSEKEATRLMLKGDGAVELRAEIEKQIAAGNARVSDLAYLLRPVFSSQEMVEVADSKNKSRTFPSSMGARGKAESILEYIYPTDWDPAQIPSVIEVDVTAKMDLKLPPNPTAFDVRNIGNELEFSAQRLAGGEMLLEISSRVTYLGGLREFGRGEEAVAQPKFIARTVKTRVSAVHREPIFLGMKTPRAAKKRDQRVLVFATPFVKAFVQQDPLADPDVGGRTVTIGVEMIEAPHVELGKLMASEPSDRRKQVGELVKAGQASLLGSGVLKSTPGQRVKIEPVHEFIYPTEYDPAEIVQKLTPALVASGKELKTPALPTAFDVRNLGMTIEAKAELLGSELIRVEIEPELVDLASQTTWGKEESATKMPLIRKLGCVTELSIKPGSAALAAILTPRVTASGKPDGQRRVLVFVWADVPAK